MTELDRVLEAVQDWSGRRLDFALATVVGVRGSTYRGLGARQLVGADGSSVGTVSGGCLDQDLHRAAERVMETGSAELVEFDLTSDDEAIWGWGIGCNGATRLLVEPAPAARELAERFRRTGARPTAVVHALGDPPRRWYLDRLPGELPPGLAEEVEEAVRSGRHRSLEWEGRHLLVEVVGAPPRLVVCGAGHDAVPLVRLGASVGMSVVVVDDRRQFLTAERFPEAASLVHADPSELATVLDPDRRTHVVIMSHNYLRDLAYLRSLVGTDVAYVGALGPGDRLRRLLDDLEREGAEVGPGDLAKLHGPAGLDLGAEGPEEIAVAIVAEILAASRRREGGFLRDRKGPEQLRRPHLRAAGLP